jgi:CheY-like chemotaxis protein
MTNRLNQHERSAAGHPSGQAVGPKATSLSAFRRGLRILLVEHDFMQAEDVREALERQGVEVIGPVASVAEAMRLLQTETGLDAAILDLRLDDGMAYPVADALRSSGIPFVFTTDIEAWMIPHHYADVPRARKPADLRRVAQAFGTQRAVSS